MRYGASAWIVVAIAMLAGCSQNYDVTIAAARVLEARAQLRVTSA